MSKKTDTGIMIIEICILMLGDRIYNRKLRELCIQYMKQPKKYKEVKK